MASRRLSALRSKDFETVPILKATIAASRRLAELKGVAATIPNQAILVNTLALQEAKDSSAIENIVTTHDELFKIAAFPDAAVEGWLNAQLEDRETPPRPSARAKAPKHATVEWIAIKPALGVRLALRWAREDAGLSQAQLAKRMGVSQQAYAKLESPDANLTMDTLERAAKALGLRVEVGLVRLATRKFAAAR